MNYYITRSFIMEGNDNDNSQVWLRQFGRNIRRDVADLHRLGVSNNRMREVPSAQVSHITLPQLASTLKVSKRSLPQIMR